MAFFPVHLRGLGVEGSTILRDSQQYLWLFAKIPGISFSGLQGVQGLRSPLQIQECVRAVMV